MVSIAPPELPPPRSCTGHPITGRKTPDGLCEPYYYPVLRMLACGHCQHVFSAVPPAEAIITVDEPVVAAATAAASS